MINIMVFAIPILIVLFPLSVMIFFCYPVRKKDDVIIIGYPIFCKRYSLLSNDFTFEVERFKALRGGSWNAVIHVYQKNSKVLIRKHILPGHTFQKSAIKEIKKVERLISS